MRFRMRLDMAPTTWAKREQRAVVWLHCVRGTPSPSPSSLSCRVLARADGMCCLLMRSAAAALIQEMLLQRQLHD